MQKILDILSLILFFYTYKKYGILYASAILIFISVTSIIYDYFILKSVNKLRLATSLIVIVSCLATIFTKNTQFVMMKVTFINMLFFTILWIGIITKKNLLYLVIGDKIDLSEQGWKRFSKHLSYLFLSLALANELARRHLSEKMWVNFKTIGITAVTLAFLMLYLPNLILKDNKTSNNNGDGSCNNDTLDNGNDS